MRLSRVATMIMVAAIGTFAVVWWVRHRHIPAELDAREPATSMWIQID